MSNDTVFFVESGNSITACAKNRDGSIKVFGSIKKTDPMVERWKKEYSAKRIEYRRFIGATLK